MRIAHLFDDPLVRELLEAAERDDGGDAVIIARDQQPPLTGHACEPATLGELVAA
jgi:hypothetical protein